MKTRTAALFTFASLAVTLGTSAAFAQGITAHSPPSDKSAQGSAIDPNFRKTNSGVIDPNYHNFNGGIIDPNDKKKKGKAGYDLKLNKKV